MVETLVALVRNPTADGQDDATRGKTQRQGRAFCGGEERFELRVKRQRENANFLARHLLLRGDVFGGVFAGGEDQASFAQRVPPQRGERLPYFDPVRADNCSQARPDDAHQLSNWSEIRVRCED